MENNLILATSTVDIPVEFNFKNHSLNEFSKAIANIAISNVSRNIELSKILGRILDTKCYEEDGFKSVADFAEKTFGIKKANAYQLANVGKRFLNSDEETASKLVKMLHGKTGNLAELVNMSDEEIEDAISSGEINSDSTQKDLRDVANSRKPLKVINEKTCVLTAVISHMYLDGKIEAISKASVIVDNVEILKAIGFNEHDKLVKLFNLENVVHVEGKEDKTKVVGFSAIAYTNDGEYTARITVEYIEKPKAPKAKKTDNSDYDMTPDEYKEFLAWKKAKEAKESKKAK